MALLPLLSCPPLTFPPPLKAKNSPIKTITSAYSRLLATTSPVRSPVAPNTSRSSQTNFSSSDSYPSSSSRNSCSKDLVRCGAVGEGSTDGVGNTVYKGFYGPWTVESSDVREVILYRSGLVTAATSFVLAASVTLLPDSNIFVQVTKNNLNLLYAMGAGGLGLSLILIHIYVTSIKRFLQILWTTGVVGSLATYITFAYPLNESLPEYVLHNPTSIWFVGPLFASLTGLVFKEGLCYGKLEAGILTFVIPALLLGHLSGLMDEGVERNLLGLWMILFVVFAARKFTQPIKDDIGDKSVFMFNALPEEEKKALLQRLDQRTDEIVD